MISASEMNHLKRMYGDDSFPMFSSMIEESEYWVPREAAHIGMNFMVSKIPHAPPGTIYEFLRNISKVWLKREQRKLNRIKDIYEKKLNDLKRKLNNAKPYKGVMQGQQIKRLKSQVKEKTLQKLSGHPKKNDVLNEDLNGQYTFDEPDTEIIPIPPHEKRLCMVNKTKQNLAIDINDPESMIRRSIDDVSKRARRAVRKRHANQSNRK